MKFASVGLFCALVLGVSSLVSSVAMATTIKTQSDAGWGKVIVAPTAATILSGRALLAPAPGTIRVQVTTEITLMNSEAFFLCSVSFNRFLNRAVNGPGSDQWWLVTPFFTAQTGQTGGTASVTRTFDFTATAPNTGVLPLVTCESRSATSGSVRAEAISTFYGND